MAAVKELLRAENDGSLSFGDFSISCRRNAKKRITMNLKEIFIK